MEILKTSSWSWSTVFLRAEIYHCKRSWAITSSFYPHSKNFSPVQWSRGVKVVGFLVKLNLLLILSKKKVPKNGQCAFKMLSTMEKMCYGDYYSIRICRILIVFVFQVLPIENKMRKREDFFWVLDLSMAFVASLFISMGFFGYITFGDQILPSVTLNLPKLP